jgi:hypothetical protein
MGLPAKGLWMKSTILLSLQLEIKYIYFTNVLFRRKNRINDAKEQRCPDSVYIVEPMLDLVFGG